MDVEWMNGRVAPAMTASRASYLASDGGRAESH